MKAKILGSAQDGGLPHPMCECNNCQRASSSRKFRRLISSFSFFVSDKAFLIDATPDIREQLRLIDKKLEGIFLTHTHIGHVLGLPFFGKEVVSTDNLEVFCTEKVEDFLKNNKPFSWLIKRNNVRLKELRPGKEINFGDSFIKPFRVKHRNEDADTVGFTLEEEKKLVFVPDIDELTEDFIKRVKKADIAVIDGTFFSGDELPGRDLSEIPHPFVKDSIEVFEDVNTEIFFTHLNHSNPLNDPGSEESKLVRSKGFKIARRGMKFDLTSPSSISRAVGCRPTGPGANPGAGTREGD